MDGEEEKTKGLVARLDAMKEGEGLDFESLIETRAFEDIKLNLLQSGSEQTFEKLKNKYPDLDLAYLDEEDETEGDTSSVKKGGGDRSGG